MPSLSSLTSEKLFWAYALGFGALLATNCKTSSERQAEVTKQPLDPPEP